MTVNDFHEDLAYSLEANTEPFWAAVYQKAFPDIKSMRLVENLEEQKAGIDRVITLDNGKEYSIDEKKRRKSWGDILLETKSSEERDTPGWINKPLRIDFMAYAFMPDKRVYLFSWPMLRRAWINFEPVWTEQAIEETNGFRIVRAANREGYTTVSVAVPIDTLLKAAKTASIIDIA